MLLPFLHEEEQQRSLSFLPSAGGMEYYLQVWVGGGGGHSLHLKDIQYHFLIFDDAEKSVTRIHHQLLRNRASAVSEEISSLPLEFLREAEDAVLENDGMNEDRMNEVDVRDLLTCSGIQPMSASIELAEDLILAESNYREQIQGMIWKLGIDPTSEPMPIIANRLQGRALFEEYDFDDLQYDEEYDVELWEEDEDSDFVLW